MNSTDGNEYGHLSAEEIWRISQLGEANAPVWSKQSWGAWRLGHSLDIKNQEMSETGRFGFDAADAKGHLGEALGNAVAKIRSQMAGYTGSTGELQAAMERVSHSRGTTHTRLEQLWTEYEAADGDGREKIEKRMRLAYSGFTKDYHDEASGFKEFATYSGVRKPVDGSTHNTDRLGGDGHHGGSTTGDPGGTGSGRFGTGPGGHPVGPGREPGPGPELQATAPSPAPATASPAPSTSTVLHTPTQSTLPPVIGSRPGGPAVYGRPQPIPPPASTGLNRPVIHGAQPTPAPRPQPGTPQSARPIGTGTAPQSGAARTAGTARSATPQAKQPDKPAAPRFRRGGGIRAAVPLPAAPKKRKTDPKPQPNPRDGAGDEEFWTMTATVVPGVIRASRFNPYRGGDTGPVAFRSTAETPPEPAPTESEPPPPGDWEPRTGTVPGVIGSRDRTAAQLRRGGGEHDPGTVAGRDGMRQREPRVYFDDSDGEDGR